MASAVGTFLMFFSLPRMLLLELSRLLTVFFSHYAKFGLHTSDWLCLKTRQQLEGVVLFFNHCYSFNRVRSLFGHLGLLNSAFEKVFLRLGRCIFRSVLIYLFLFLSSLNVILFRPTFSSNEIYFRLKKNKILDHKMKVWKHFHF